MIREEGGLDEDVLATDKCLRHAREIKFRMQQMIRWLSVCGNGWYKNF